MLNVYPSGNCFGGRCCTSLGYVFWDTSQHLVHCTENTHIFPLLTTNTPWSSSIPSKWHNLFSMQDGFEYDITFIFTTVLYQFLWEAQTLWESFSVSVIVHILDPFCNISSWVSTDFEEATSILLFSSICLLSCDTMTWFPLRL